MIASITEAMLLAGVLNVTSGLLALEIDHVLIDLNNGHVDIRDKLAIKGLMISKAIGDTDGMVARVTVAMG